MAIPVSPVVKKFQDSESTYGKEQTEYNNLPALILSGEEGEIITRWKLSWFERLQVLLTGNVYIWVKTFNNPLQPLRVEVQKPELAPLD